MATAEINSNNIADAPKSPANPEDCRSILQQANDASGRQEYDIALRLYTKVLPSFSRDGKTADVLEKRAACLYALEKYELALGDAFEYTKQRPGCIGGFIVCGKCLVKLNRFDEALAAYRKGLEIDANDKVIVTDLREMQDMIIRAREEGAKAGEADYDAIRLCTQDPYPGDDELLELEKEILEKKHLNDFPDIQTVPSDRAVSEKKAAVARQQRETGNMDMALQIYTSALEMDPRNFDLWREKAELLHAQGNFKEALKCCNVIIPQFRQPDVWKLGGKILRDLLLPVSAESWLRRASRLTENKDREAAILFQQVRVQRLYGPLVIGLPITVDFTQYGRAVKATEDAREGQTVFADTPLVLAQTLDSLHVPACSQCAKSLLCPEDYFDVGTISSVPALKKAVQKYWPKVQKIPCEHCGKETYCSKRCEKEAWVRHHQIICPSRNEYSLKLYEVCAQHSEVISGEKGAWNGVWNASFSPMVLARIWASIICEAKRLAKASGHPKPSNMQWSLAMAPYRRFIAYGSASNAKVIPKMHTIMAAIFKDCGDGISYDITEREFDGRYFQSTCNVQAFSDPDPPLKVFVEKVRATPKGSQIMDFVTNGQPEAVFAGLFSLHACMNHSCDNNVEIMDASVDGVAGVKVRAKRPIRSGDELFTTYIDTTMSRKERRSWLYRAYNFWCNCDRCQSEGDGPDSCTNCGENAMKDKKFPTCGKCRRAWYCSAKCQKEAWKKGHKRICSTPHSKTSAPSDAIIRNIVQ